MRLAQACTRSRLEQHHSQVAALQVSSAATIPVALAALVSLTGVRWAEMGRDGLCCQGWRRKSRGSGADSGCCQATSHPTCTPPTRAPLVAPTADSSMSSPVPTATATATAPGLLMSLPSTLALVPRLCPKTLVSVAGVTTAGDMSSLLRCPLGALPSPCPCSSIKPTGCAQLVHTRSLHFFPITSLSSCRSAILPPSWPSPHPQSSLVLSIPMARLERTSTSVRR